MGPNHLSLSTAERINAEHDAAVASAQDAIGHVIEAGRLLIEAKAGLGHGEWMSWVKANCRFTYRMAAHYMRLAKCETRFTFDGSDPPRSIRQALEVLSGPDEAEDSGQGDLFPDEAEPDEKEPDEKEPDVEPDVEPDDEPNDEDDPKARLEAEFRPRSEPRLKATPETRPEPQWSKSELHRRDAVERLGGTVLANQRTDHALIGWAKAQGCYVAIDRGAYPLGNPLKIGHPRPTRDEVIAWYEEHWLPAVEDSIDWDSLRGKVLGCWCYPEPCHGDVIKDLLESDCP